MPHAMTHNELIRHAYLELYHALPKPLIEQHWGLIEEALTIAFEAHKSQTRANGIPYILHPLAVALILVKEMLQKDSATIVISAILHDVVEDNSNYTIDGIRAIFGDEVAFLVESVTKPNKNQTDNFQHILGAARNDIRVLFLKLSDRLHNMRTLSNLRPEKQWKIASETQFFYAPLAGRLGLYKVKSELENLAFQFLNPNEYARIESLLENDRKQTACIVAPFSDECRRLVSENLGCGIGGDIRYRRPYSIWREMQEKHCDFEHIPFKHYLRLYFNYDRVYAATGYNSKATLSSEKEIILRIYGTLTERFREQPGGFVNYVDQPKANGYRSVHFRLLNPSGGIEELHVSSEEMRMQSIYGCVLDSKKQWVTILTDVLHELAEDTESIMPGIHDSLYNEDIVAYSPKSKAITLPKGATALDFAYSVHSDIGDHAYYARINGRLSSIKTELKRGDYVEIGTEESVHPMPDWLDAVVSYKAKKQINKFLKKRPKSPYNLCSYCHPMPGSENIGFKDADGIITIHRRNCKEAIRMASEKGNTIVDVDYFEERQDVLFPVIINVIGIDRYHLLRDIIDCIVERYRLSICSLNTSTHDAIVNCHIEFVVHSARQLNDTIADISSIPGIEEVLIA